MKVPWVQGYHLHHPSDFVALIGSHGQSTERW
jgi:hypothetical protein